MAAQSELSPPLSMPAASDLVAYQFFSTWPRPKTNNNGCADIHCQTRPGPGYGASIHALSRS